MHRIDKIPGFKKFLTRVQKSKVGKWLGRIIKHTPADKKASSSAGSVIKKTFPPEDKKRLPPETINPKVNPAHSDIPSPVSEGIKKEVEPSKTPTISETTSRRTEAIYVDVKDGHITLSKPFKDMNLEEMGANLRYIKHLKRDIKNGNTEAIGDMDNRVATQYLNELIKEGITEQFNRWDKQSEGNFDEYGKRQDVMAQYKEVGEAIRYLHNLQKDLSKMKDDAEREIFKNLTDKYTAKYEEKNKEMQKAVRRIRIEGRASERVSLESTEGRNKLKKMINEANGLLNSDPSLDTINDQIGKLKEEIYQIMVEYGYEENKYSEDIKETFDTLTALIKKFETMKKSKSIVLRKDAQIEKIIKEELPALANELPEDLKEVSTEGGKKPRAIKDLIIDICESKTISERNENLEKAKKTIDEIVRAYRLKEKGTYPLRKSDEKALRKAVQYINYLKHKPPDKPFPETPTESKATQKSLPETEAVLEEESVDKKDIHVKIKDGHYTLSKPLKEMNDDEIEANQDYLINLIHKIEKSTEPIGITEVGVIDVLILDCIQERVGRLVKDVEDRIKDAGEDVSARRKVLESSISQLEEFKSENISDEIASLWYKFVIDPLIEKYAKMKDDLG